VSKLCVACVKYGAANAVIAMWIGENTKSNKFK